MVLKTVKLDVHDKHIHCMGKAICIEHETTLAMFVDFKYAKLFLDLLIHSPDGLLPRLCINTIHERGKEEILRVVRLPTIAIIIRMLFLFYPSLF